MPTICRVVNYANACPLSPLMHVVLLQWLAHHTACTRGRCFRIYNILMRLTYDQAKREANERQQNRLAPYFGL